MPKEIDLSYSSILIDELRSPITMIYSAVQLLETLDPVNPEMLEYTNVIKTNVLRLNKLVYNISDFTNMDSQITRSRIGEYDIIAFLKSACDMTLNLIMPNLASHFDVALEFKNDTTQQYVYFDIVKLEKIFFNILSNAIKFSKKGKKNRIIVSFKEEQDMWVISVRDHGIGLSDNKKNIFEKYKYKKTILEDTSGSTGFGLAVSRKLVMEMGGEITYKSLEDGAEFEIHIPQTPVIEKFNLSERFAGNCHDIEKIKLLTYFSEMLKSPNC